MNCYRLVIGCREDRENRDDKGFFRRKETGNIQDIG